ncbi:MAG: hypothetical protein ACOZF2_05265 [Thermodesulfobacteriota bacterium]
MDMLAQFGFMGNLSPTFCYLYGMVLAMASACLALNLKPPVKP